VRNSKHDLKRYEFRVEGQLDPCWSEWFEGLEIRCEMDEETRLPITVLAGPVSDQSALHGILEKISRLNLVLRSVEQVR
jgi:hypothetical protein